MNKRVITYKEAIEEAFTEEFVRDPRFFILGEDVVDNNMNPAQPTLALLKEKFPARVINHLPLVEEMLPGIALGMNIGGLKPVIQFDRSTFLLHGLDQIYRLGIWRYRMAEESGPGVVIRLAHDGYDVAGAEFSASLLGLIFHLPNICIVTPSNPYFAKGLLTSALRADNPVVFFEHKRLYGFSQEVSEKEESIPFGDGVATILTRGEDVSLISWAYVSHHAVKAAEKLAEENIGAEVISLQTIQPMDMKTILNSVKKTGKAAIIEEDMLRGGIGAEISARITEALPNSKICRIASKNVPLPRHFQLVLPGVTDIVSAVRMLIRSSH